MIVVSDAGPLRYLAVIHLAELLGHYFDKVLVPPAVAADLSHDNTPAEARLLLATPPAWLERAEVYLPLVESRALGRGEREAITLALEKGIGRLLCDDAGARAFAESRNIRVIGTLGILQQAALDGRIELAAAIQ